MTPSAKKYYLSLFEEEYDVDPEKILQVMAKNEKIATEDAFMDWDYWEDLCREELAKIETFASVNPEN